MVCQVVELLVPCDLIIPYDLMIPVASMLPPGGQSFVLLITSDYIRLSWQVR